jgi:general secretion pathway protein D
MKKPSVSPNTFSFSLRRLSAAALLCCSVAGMPARLAAPGDEAALTVGADIESVIKAVGHYTNITFVIDPRVKGTITLVSEKSISKTQAFAAGLGAAPAGLRRGLRRRLCEGGAGSGRQAAGRADPGGQRRQPGEGRPDRHPDFYLNYESSANLLAVLRPLISPNNTINANRATTRW